MTEDRPSAAPDRDRPYAEHDLDRECFWLHLTEEQATVLAGGFVPNSVKSVLRELLDYDIQDQLRAERPALPKKRKKSGATEVKPGVFVADESTSVFTAENKTDNLDAGGLPGPRTP